MPRLVYALLRSPLLGYHSGHHPDTRTSLRLLWSALPPEDLQTAVYPHLSSYQDPETQVSLPLTSCPAHCQLYAANLAFPSLKHCLIPLMICSGIAACTVVENAVHCCRGMDLPDVSPSTAALTLWLVHCYRHFPCSSIHTARPQVSFVASCVCPCENMLSTAPVCGQLDPL